MRADPTSSIPADGRTGAPAQSARVVRRAAGLALLAALLAGPGAAQTGALPTVTAAAPVSRLVAQWDEHLGRIEASAYVEIRPRVSGEVAEVHFRDGSLVMAGQLLFTIDQRPFRIAVDTAQAEVARSEARLTLARQQLARYLPLAQQRVSPEAELDVRRSALGEAEAGLAAARATLRQAELNLDFTEIRAPRPGRVSDRRVDAGNLVSEGQTLLTTLSALDPIYVTFDVSEAQYLRYARTAEDGFRGAAGMGGLPVQLRLLDETAFTQRGTLDFVDSGFDRRSGTIRGRAVAANPDLFLTPGAFARIRVAAGEARALLVPDASVVADQAGRMVLTVGPDGTVAPRPVQLGPLVDGLRVVRSGLTPEDRVIVGGLHRARPGVRVTVEPARIGADAVAAIR
jgi:RND family efflux transporter MFP subunit